MGGGSDRRNSSNDFNATTTAVDNDTPRRLRNARTGDGTSALILSTGARYGNHYTTQQMLDALVRQQKAAGNDDFDVEFATRVFNKCGFERHSVVLDLPDVFRRFSRSEYLEHRATNLVGLAERAGAAALDGWGGPRSAITHLFWGTMTGALHSPTIDIELTKRLGLNLDVERTSIEGMGCLTGFRLLNLARQVVKGDPEARVLVVAADLRSALGNSLPENPTKTDIVSVALFRDAASSAVVGSGSALRPEECPCYEIVTGASRIVDSTRHLVNYFETDDGAIRLHLDRKLPDHIGKAEPDFVASLLEKGRRALSKVDSQIGVPPLEEIDILCHTGGPRVLSEVAKSLGVKEQNLRSSWEVMTAHGNLSGASNLAVLDHHNQITRNESASHCSEWAICLSMGPGICLEGILLRNLRGGAQSSCATPSICPLAFPTPHMYPSTYAKHAQVFSQQRKIVHIVGGGISGLTLAAALDPAQYEVRVFEAAAEVREKGYGVAIWPSTMKILRDKMGVVGLDLMMNQSMVIHSVGEKFDVPGVGKAQDKGFMQRSHLLGRIKEQLEKRHPGCISAGHKCLRVRFEGDHTTATYETSDDKNPIVSHSCHLLVGADGVNSVVRRYVAWKADSRQFGHMTAYRFLVPAPSKVLLEGTWNRWNLSVGEHIHSPCYHISNEGTALNVVVLEYDGKPPGPPRRPSLEELTDVAFRSKLSFVIDLLRHEKIADLVCYSTYHVDCEPWHRPSAVIIGDAAHAYGPLTARMANLAINDAHTLATMLNEGSSKERSQEQVLQEWELVQRPKFDVTRIRTLRHLQLYSPSIRFLTRFLWRNFPKVVLKYFGSILAFDFEVQEPHGRGYNKSRHLAGIVGPKSADPLVPYIKGAPRNAVLAPLFLAIMYLLYSSTIGGLTSQLS